MILRHGTLPQGERDPGEDDEIEDDADVEEPVVQIAGLCIEQRVFPGLLEPPLEEQSLSVFALPSDAEQQRKKKQNKIRQELAQVFQLPANHHRPLGIGGVMQACPEKCTNADGEEIAEAKQPGVGELLAPGRRKQADQRDQDAGHAGTKKQSRQASRFLDVIGLRGRRSGGVRVVAHGFASISFFRSSGRSVSFMLWLFCKVRT